MAKLVHKFYPTAGKLHFHFHTWRTDNDHATAILNHEHVAGSVEHDHPGHHVNLVSLINDPDGYAFDYNDDHDSTFAGPASDRDFAGYPTLGEPT